MQKIAETTCTRQGGVSQVITIPRVYINDNKLAGGDRLNIYRTIINGIDALVIMPKNIVSEKEVKTNKGE